MKSSSLPLTVLLAVATGQVSAAPGLSLDASSRQLVAGRDEPVQLVARGPAEALRDARLVCSHGALQRRHRGGNGELRFELTAPRAADAGWLVCAIASPGTRAVATTTLELQRREVLALANLPPLSRVEVRLGASTFGPVRANGAGFAEVPVLLTPAARQAEVVATPPGQAPQTRTMVVSQAPTAQALAIAPPSELVADGEDSAPLFAFTFNERGELSSEPLTVSSDEGTAVVQPLGTGAHLVLFTPYPRATAQEATITLRGASGKPALAKLPVAPGVVPQVELRSNVASVPADGVSSAELTLWVRDQTGRPLPNQKLELLASSGSVTAVEDRGGGEYAARFLSATGSGPQAQVTAIVEGGATATITFNLVAPPRLTVEASPREAPADGTSRVRLSILARGADGAPLPDGSVLRLSTSLGQVPPAVVTVGGRATAELVAGVRAGLATIDIRSEDATANAQVRLVPGPAAQVGITPQRDALTCDGADSVLLHLQVRDRHGNGVAAATVEVYEAEHPADPALAGSDPATEEPPIARGRFDRVQTVGDGEFQVRYHAPPGCDRPAVSLLASSGGIKATARVRLVRGFASAFGLTARLGGVHNLGRLASFGLELEGDVPVGRLSPRLLATAGVQLTLSAPFEAPGFSPGSGAFLSEGTALAASVFAGPRWTLYQDDRAQLYAGVGLDGHLLRSALTLRSARVTTVEEHLRTGFALGGHLRLGGGYALGPGLLVAQLRLGAAPFVTEATLRSQLSGVSLSFGYRLPL